MSVFSKSTQKELIRVQLIDDVPIYGLKDVMDYLLQHYEPEIILEVKRELAGA